MWARCEPWTWMGPRNTGLARVRVTFVSLDTQSELVSSERQSKGLVFEKTWKMT